MLNKIEIFKTLQEHQQDLSAFGIKRLGLFGSFAKEDYSKNSDLDFIVEFKEKSFDSYMGLKLCLEELFHRKVDLVLPNTIKPRLQKAILKETIYAPGL